jgi:catalase
MATRLHLAEHVHTDIIAAAEMSERLSKGSVMFHVLVQMAEDGDDVTNATVIWPETRQLVEFGTVTLSERVDELAPERRKIIFHPVPRVDGIDPSGDPLTEVRRMSTC